MRDLSHLPDLELALIQTELAWQDPAANRAHFQALLDQAQGADLVVLPEMFSTGFSMDSAALAEPEDGPTSLWLREQAQRIGAVVTGSLIIQAADGSYRNRLLWARPTAARRITTSATCSAWPASTSIMPRASSNCWWSSRVGRFVR